MIKKNVLNFIFDEEAQTTTEYALILSIAVFLFAILRLTFQKYMIGSGGFSDKLARGITETFFPDGKDLHDQKLVFTIK